LFFLALGKHLMLNSSLAKIHNPRLSAMPLKPHSASPAPHSEPSPETGTQSRLFVFPQKPMDDANLAESHACDFAEAAAQHPWVLKTETCGATAEDTYTTGPMPARNPFLDFADRLLGRSCKDTHTRLLLAEAQQFNRDA